MRSNTWELFFNALFEKKCILATDVRHPAPSYNCIGECKKLPNMSKVTLVEMTVVKSNSC